MPFVESVVGESGRVAIEVSCRAVSFHFRVRFFFVDMESLLLEKMMRKGVWEIG